MNEKWARLVEGLRTKEPMRIARRYSHNNSSNYMLLGFCDASQRAYAAVAYLSGDNGSCSLIASKTRVAPLLKQTIPRLELLGAVLLARLMTTIKDALGDSIKDCICFTDSQVTLHWIKGTERSWRPFVQNRVAEIRGKVPTHCWRHCRGRDNPADLPSRELL